MSLIAVVTGAWLLGGLLLALVFGRVVRRFGAADDESTTPNETDGADGADSADRAAVDDGPDPVTGPDEPGSGRPHAA